MRLLQILEEKVFKALKPKGAIADNFFTSPDGYLKVAEPILSPIQRLQLQQQVFSRILIMNCRTPTELLAAVHQVGTRLH